MICSRCVMDTTDPDITFDENGVCNHCKRYAFRANTELHYDKLNEVISRIKQDGKQYDCVIGLSGGLDSSYVALKIVELGLHPIAITADNEWDTKVAQQNVKTLLSECSIDWIHYGVDWKQFRDIQLAFLGASVINAEAPSDQVIVSLLYQEAIKQDIKWILHGGNITTESIMPESWGYEAKDWRQIKGIHRAYGKESLKNFPHMTLWHWFYYTFVKRIKWFPILNYLPYDREKAKLELEEKVGWQDYGEKHQENIYTRFFQGYILPKKFGIDKRKAHYSTLINSGQMTRDEALVKLNSRPYSLPTMMEDKKLISNKLGITRGYLDFLLFQKPKSHRDYPNNEFWFKALGDFVKYAKKIAIGG